jgi:hypothetical protein
MIGFDRASGSWQTRGLALAAALLATISPAGCASLPAARPDPSLRVALLTPLDGVPVRTRDVLSTTAAGADIEVARAASLLELRADFAAELRKRGVAILEADLPALTGKRPSTAQLAAIGRAGDADLVVFTELLAYGDIRRSWLWVLAAQGLAAGIGHGVVVAAATGSSTYGWWAGAGEFALETATWVGGALVGSRGIDPVLARVSLIACAMARARDGRGGASSTLPAARASRRGRSPAHRVGSSGSAPAPSRAPPRSPRRRPPELERRSDADRVRGPISRSDRNMAGIYKAYDIRGIYPSEINESIARQVGQAFRAVLDEEDFAHGGDKVVVSRDMRPSSEPLAAALVEGLTTAGLDVLDIGLSTTSMNYFAIAPKRRRVQVTTAQPPQHNAQFRATRQRPVSATTALAAEKTMPRRAVDSTTAHARRRCSRDYRRHAAFPRTRRMRRLRAGDAQRHGTMDLPRLRSGIELGFFSPLTVLF